MRWVALKIRLRKAWRRHYQEISTLVFYGLALLTGVALLAGLPAWSVGVLVVAMIIWAHV